MNYNISHIETDEEIYIKFTIWNQTFTLCPFEKQIDNKINEEQIEFYYNNLWKALNNLINNNK